MCYPLVVGWLLLVSAPLTATSTHAAPVRNPSSGDTLTLALTNGTTFVYAGQPGGTAAPRFTATLVLAAKRTLNTYMQVTINVGGQTFGNGVSSVSADGLTYIFIISSAGIVIPAGSQSVVAQFYDATTQTTVQSNNVAFTIVPATPQLNCVIDNYSIPYDPGQPLRFRMSFDGDGPNAPVDWQNATYQIRFTGITTKTSITTGALSPDSQDTVSVLTPSQFDWWNADCIFRGTANFTSATARETTGQILVSAKHPLGTVQFTSVPWPLVVNQSAQVDVVFRAAPDGPVPDGYFSLQVGNASTHEIPVGTNGETKGTLPGLSYLGGITQVFVDYQGDPYYNASAAGFPMPSAPPANGSGGGSSGGSSGGSQPTATSAQIPAAAGTATAPRTAGGISGSSSGASEPIAYSAHGPGTTGGVGLPWWLVPLGLLIVVGGGAGVFFLVRGMVRKRTSKLPDGPTVEIAREV